MAKRTSRKSKRTPRKSKRAPRKSKSSAAAASLDGYLYQQDVSIWLALDLVVAKQITHSVQLEPPTQEDLEAQLDVSDASKLTVNVSVGQRRLIVQVKSRSTGPWTVGDIETLLKHGTDRTPPAERLQDKGAHYLLVTSADIGGTARGLRVVTALEEPNPALMPATISAVLPSDAAGRVGVLSGVDQEKLEARLRTLLEESFRVPRPRYVECLAALREEAMHRMRGAGDGVWTREELQNLIRRFDGYFASSAEVENYVKPNNWKQLLDTLWQNHAVIITGGSGTGKTSTADYLVHEVREKTPGVTVVAVTGGPAQVRAHQKPGPVVFSIEDPWGRYRVVPGAEPWNDELTKLLATASANRRFIITSRSDVFKESGEKKSLPSRIFVRLEAENYGERDLIRMFENRVLRVARPLQHIAVKYRGEVLSKLTLPLEIQKFFDALAEGRQTDENEAQLVHRCIAEANRNAIENTLVQQVDAREAWAWAAVIWGLLAAAPKQGREYLDQVQAGLARKSDKLEDGLDQFVGFLVTARNLRQGEGGVFGYYHPRVEAGLLQALKKKPGVARRVLGYLVEILVDVDSNGDDWGRRAAANMVQTMRREDALRFSLPEAVQQSLDSWLAEQLVGKSEEFESDLQLAADVGSERSAPSEVARWLLHVERTPPNWGFGSPWSPKPDTREWYERIAADPNTLPICARFVREILPRTNLDYPRDLAEHMSRLSSGLAPAFRDAARGIVGHGYLSNADVVAEGAVADLDAFGPVLDAAIAAHDAALARDNGSLWLELANGEYSEDYAHHLHEQVGEEYIATDMLLETYVARLRGLRGWTAVGNHPKVLKLYDAWLSALPSSHLAGKTVDFDDDEIVGLLETGWGTPEERMFWEKMRRNWSGAAAARLRERMVSGSADLDIRLSATSCFAVHRPQDVESIAEVLAAPERSARAIEMMHDLHIVGGQDEEDANERRIGLAIIERLPDFAKPLAMAMLQGDGDAALGGDALKLLDAVDGTGNDAFGLMRARLHAAAGNDATEIVKELLALPPETSDRRREMQADAAEFAVAREMWPVVEACLVHPLARVKVVALRALAARITGPLPQTLLALAEDKSSAVRRALVTLLKDRPDPAHADALVKLVGDEWTRFEAYEHAADFPIAQSAAEALSVPPELSEHVLEKIEEIVRSTKDETLQSKLLVAMVKNGSADGVSRVVRIALSQGVPMVSAAACEALFEAAAALDEAVVAGFDTRHIKGRASRVAVSMTLVLARHGTDKQIDDIARFISTHESRRVLLVPLFLAASAAGRAEEVTRKIAVFIGKDRAERILAAFNGKRKLPAAALDELGDVRTVAAVKLRLPNLFKPKSG